MHFSLASFVALLAGSGAAGLHIVNEDGPGSYPEAVSTPLQEYAHDLCAPPIAVVPANATLPPKPESHNDQDNWWLGKCVRVVWNDWGPGDESFHTVGAERGINVIVGMTLPAPGKAICHHEKKDYTGTGYCGRGDKKRLGVRLTSLLHAKSLACLSHDVCIWARCVGAESNFIKVLGGPLGLTSLTSNHELKKNIRKGDPACGLALFESIDAYFPNYHDERRDTFWEANPNFTFKQPVDPYDDDFLSDDGVKYKKRSDDDSVQFRSDDDSVQFFSQLPD